MDVKQALEDAKQSKTQQMLLEYMDDTLEQISSKKGKRRPIHDKLDTMIGVFDDTRRAFDQNTKAMVTAFGRSVQTITKAVQEKDGEEVSKRTSDLVLVAESTRGLLVSQNEHTKAIETNSAVALKYMSETASGVNSIRGMLYEWMEDIKAEKDKEIKQIPELKKKDRDKSSVGGIFDTLKGLGSAGMAGIMGASGIKAISNLLTFLSTTAKMATKFGKVLLKGGLIVSAISGVYNAISTFSNDDEIAKIAGKSKDAITHIDKWAAALSSGLSAMTFDLVSPETMFKTIKGGLDAFVSGVDYLFDPDTGIFGKTTSAVMDLIENFNYENVAKLVGTVMQDTLGQIGDLTVKAIDSIAEVFSMENIAKFIEPIKSAIMEAVSSMFGFLPDSLKRTIMGGGSMLADGASALGSAGKSALDAVSNMSFDDIKSGFNRFMQPTVDPMQRVQSGIAARQSVDKKPYMITKEKADNEAKFREQLKAQAPVIVNNNTSNNTTVSAPVRYDILDSGTMYLAGGR
jgi:hypothetical protein